MSNPKVTLADPSELDRKLMREHGIHWHPKGGWARKFPGDSARTYFGRVATKAAIKAHAIEEKNRFEGKRSEAKLLNLTIEDAIDLFLDHADQQHKDGAIGAGQRARYDRELDFLVKATKPNEEEPILGGHRKLAELCRIDAPEKFFRPLREAAVCRGLSGGEKAITQIRSFLDWCSDVRRLIPAPFYGGCFSLPSEKEKRKARKAERRAKGQAFWKPEEIRQIVEAANRFSAHRHAQILLTLNGGMGATDLSNLEDADIDWDRRCIHTDRSKTLVPRVVPLWDETIGAMKASREKRAVPLKAEWDSLFFLTRAGRPLVQEYIGEDQKLHRTDSLKNWMYKLMHGDDRKHWRQPAIRLRHLRRHKAGYYTLRAVFLTLARGHGGDPNLDAVVVGQKLDRAVLENYLRGDMLAKLRVVTDHVRAQLWP